LTDPAIPPILKRILALDTPVALRILELGLFGLLMWGCAFCMESTTVPKGLKLIATFLFVPGVFIGAIMLISIGVMVVRDIDKPPMKK
jgi:uncharacterized membrane protein YvlD (DUF360 family)